MFAKIQKNIEQEKHRIVNCGNPKRLSLSQIIPIRMERSSLAFGTLVPYRWDECLLPMGRPSHRRGTSVPDIRNRSGKIIKGGKHPLSPVRIGISEISAFELVCQENFIVLTNTEGKMGTKNDSAFTSHWKHYHEPLKVLSWAYESTIMICTLNGRSAKILQIEGRSKKNCKFFEI